MTTPMLTTVQTAAEQVPVQAWATLLALATLILGRRIGSKTRAVTRRAKAPNPKKRRTLTGFAGMGLVVLLGFGLSANTSIVFAGARLHMKSPWTLTIGLALEGIVLGLTLYSWAFEDKGTARTAYLLVLAQAIGAVEVVRFQHEDLGTAVVRIVGPVMLAYGLHKLLGLETKLKKIEIRSDGILARAWRDRLKRLESKLGIGSRGADAESISRRNAQDKLITLATLGKPWWAIGKFGTRRYEKALMRAGDASFHGLGDTLDELGVEMRITTRIDRMQAFKNLPDRSEEYSLRSLRPAFDPQGAPEAQTNGGNALTSGGAPGHTPGHGAGTPNANPATAQANQGPTGGTPDRRTLAFDLYFDLRVTGQAPSQNAFEKAWRDAGYGLKTDDIRALYKEVHIKVTGNNP
ncbi:MULTISPECIES: hypothetical protein [unclassified Streptomyces]|uniref:hypothetical protein n=1 Tax=unclassified Streptomyces TaxID=2593676 RepID=UPI000804D8CB|nr:MULTISPECIES: hypothetical protein [unclassified Streptomyces]MYR75195.1 hypothetical protein [Streptomyces sp. SID4925]SBU98149.1 hypothetical protein YUMDRAFT_06072 [Streptomyces sp. OspMP-M45]